MAGRPEQKRRAAHVNDAVKQARSTLARELIEVVRQHVGSCPGDTQLRLLTTLRAKCEELGVKVES